jgi:hypothetical protein
MILRPNNTYEIKIDGVQKAKGSLEEDWDLLPPKEIPDPNAKKPADWVDEKEIDDPNDKKPEGWDDIPPEIRDPNAKKPDDWDDELDGEWEPPMIPNPDYKGPWKVMLDSLSCTSCSLVCVRVCVCVVGRVAYKQKRKEIVVSNEIEFLCLCLCLCLWICSLDVSLIPLTKASGFIQRFLIPNTNLTLNSTLMTRSVLWLSKCGK